MAYSLAMSSDSYSLCVASLLILALSAHLELVNSVTGNLNRPRNIRDFFNAKVCLVIVLAIRYAY